MSKPQAAKARPWLSPLVTSAQPEADNGPSACSGSASGACTLKDTERVSEFTNSSLEQPLSGPGARQQGQLIIEEKGKAVRSLLSSNEPKGILAENGWSSSLDTEEIIRQETYELMMEHLSTRLATVIISFGKKIARMWRNQTVQNALARHTSIILQPYCQQNSSKKFRNHPFFSLMLCSAWVFKAPSALPREGSWSHHSLTSLCQLWPHCELWQVGKGGQFQ